jgi:hypothetical protein
VKKHQNRIFKAELRKLKCSLQEDNQIDCPFSIEQLNIAIKSTKLGKAAGLGGLYPEFIHSFGK